MCIYPIGTTDACRIAAEILRSSGLSMIDHPSPDITHLLLDVPSFLPDGRLRCGTVPEEILRMLPQDICVIGGNLNVPSLEDYQKIDLLKNPIYVSMNASITADCALRLAGSHMNRTFQDAPTLIIGWGRIGKTLAQKLKSIGCPVTVAARKESDRALLEALGYCAISIDAIPGYLPSFSLLFNTVPAPILDIPIPPDCIALELASQPGLPSDNVINAKGLPGRMAPVTSGNLIAKTIQNILQEEYS